MPPSFLAFSGGTEVATCQESFAFNITYGDNARIGARLEAQTEEVDWVLFD